VAVEAERATTTHSSRIARQKSPKRVATFVRALIFSSFSFYSSLFVSASHFDRLRQRRRLWPRLSLLRRLCDYTTALPVYRRLIPARPDAAKRATTTKKNGGRNSWQPIIFFPFPDYYFLCAVLLVFRQLDLISNSALILCVVRLI
jgi:hypothetical protein